MQWINMKDRQPELHSQEILFIAKEGFTEERIGLAIPDFKYVLLKRTDISFENILYWLPIPESPEA